MKEGNIMPLVRFDLIKGRTQEDIENIMKITQDTVVKDFHVDQRDCYQIVTQHESYEMNIMDTGLDIERSQNVLVISITSRPREKSDIENFYADLANGLSEKKLVEKNDLVINMTINGDANWSFGFGEAQFLTGKL
jgi:hypothetical protein